MSKPSIDKMKKWFSKSQRLLSAVNRMKNVGVGSAQSASRVIYAGGGQVVKATSKSFRYMPKMITWVLLFIVIFVYGTGIFSMLFSLLQQLLLNFKSVIGLFGVSWFSMYFFVMFLVFLVTALTPKKEDSDIFKKEIQFFMWVGLVLFAVVFYLNSGFFQNHTAASQLKIVQNKTSQESQTLWGQITCSFNPSCLQTEYNKQNAQAAPTVNYKIDLNKGSIEGYSYGPNDLKNPLELYYDFTSTGNLKVVKINCYINSISKDNLFYSKTLDDSILTKSSQSVPRTYSCGNLYEAVKKVATQANKSYTIIPVLTLSLDMTYTQTIPIVDYKIALSKLGLDPSQKYSKYYIIQQLKNANLISSSDYNFVESSGFFDVSNLVNRDLPLLFGDGVNSDFQIPITFQEKDSQMGKFTSGKVISISKPNTIDFQSGSAQDYMKQIQFSNNKFKLNLNLKENEQADPNLNQFLTKQQLKIKLNVDFQNENRFQLQVVNFPVNTKTTTTKSLSQSSSSNTQNSNPACPTNSLLGTPDSNCIYTHNADSSFTTTPLYYKQVNGAWVWSPDKMYWMPLSEQVVGGKFGGQSPTQANLNFMQTLPSNSSLINSVKSCSTNSMLGTPDSNCIYTHNADSNPSTTPLYYKQVNGVLEWSPDQTYWMPLSESEVGGKFGGQSPSQANLDFIQTLQNNFS